MKKSSRALALFLVLIMVFSVFCVVPAAAEDEAAVDPDDYRGLVISKVFANGGKADGVTQYSFIELYNASGKALNLDGLALYYKTAGDTEYQTMAFDAVTMAADSYYLVRCKAAKDYLTENEIIRVTDYDASWNIKLDNKEVCLVLAAAGRTLDAAAQAADLSGVISYFCATADFYFDSSYVIDDISKSKYAVRTALKEDSGWSTFNLTKVTSSRLAQILPMCSKGVAGEIAQIPLNEVFFSEPAGFYDSAISLFLSAAEGYSIYYTTDGSDPRESSTAKLYTDALTLRDSTHLGYGDTTRHVASVMGNSYIPAANNLLGGYVIKAYATNGEDATDVYTGSYFISESMKDYGVTVMSISMDKTLFAGPNGFYNNYYTVENLSNPASRAMMEVFDSNGVRQGYANVELAINGHGSSVFDMKSMKVKFNKKLDNDGAGGRENKLYFDLFDGTCTNDKGQSITTFNKLVLRNGGNDEPYTLLRDAYQQRTSKELVDDLNVDTTASAPVLVFLNGEFWGVYNIRERYTQDYVEAHYGVNKDNVVTIETDFEAINKDWNSPLMVNDGEPGDADPFNNLVAYMNTHSLANADNYAYVASQIDIDSFIDMYVMRLYFNAADWPQNNLKIWRNKAGAEDPSGVDDKWHFTLHDMDMGMGFQGSTPATANNFSWIDLMRCPIGQMMHALVQNAGFRAQFLARFYQVAKYDLNTTQMLEILDMMLAERADLMPLQYARWSQTNGTNASAYASNVSTMQEYIYSRKQNAIQQLCGYFNVSEQYLRSLIGYGETSYRGAYLDNFYINGTACNSSGNASRWMDANLSGRVIDCSDDQVQTIAYRGWVGFEGDIEAIGYQINQNEPVFGNFRITAEGAVLYDTNGGPKAIRFNVEVPVNRLEGRNTVCVVVLVDGELIRLDGTQDAGFNTCVTCTNGVFEFKTKTCYDLVKVNGTSVGSTGNNPNPMYLTMNEKVGQELCLWGWHANNEGIASFGYRVDGGTIVYNNAFAYKTEQAVIDAGIAAVGRSATSSRMNVCLPIQAGTHTVEVICNTGLQEISIWTVQYTDNEPIPEPQKPIITCVVNGKSTLVEVEFGNNTGLLPVPEVEGMQFEGWYTDSEFKNAADLSNVQADMTVYGKYTKIVIPFQSMTSYDLLYVDDTSVGSTGNNPNPAVLSLYECVGKQLSVRGWHANNEGIVAFGYRVDGGSIVYSDSFAKTAEQNVIDAASSVVGNGAFCSRMNVTAPIQAGTHTVEVICNTGVQELSIWTVKYTDNEPIPETQNPVIIRVVDGEEIPVEVERGDNSGLLPVPEVDGMLFTGWYADDAYTMTADLSDVQTNMTVYGRYVDSVYFSLSMTKTVTKGKLMKLRAYSVVDDAKSYDEYGLMIKIGDGEYEKYVNERLYSSVSGNKVTSLFSGATASTAKMYYKDITVNTLADGTEISVITYFVTPDGTTVYGDSVTIVCHPDTAVIK